MKYTPLVFFFSLCYISPSFAIAQGLEFEETDMGIRLLDNGQERFFYQKATISKDGKYPRAHYFHPIRDWDGTILTEDFPEDHLHQRGMFWAWHQLYHEDQRLGNGWLCENFVWDVRRSFTAVDGNSAHLKSVVFWMDTTGNEYVIESMDMIFNKINEDSFEFDFEIRIQALREGITFGGSTDNKGYGGFSMRLQLPDDIRFESGGKEVLPKETAIQVGEAVSFIGSFNSKSPPYSITLSGYPDELPSYQGFILRKKDSMQNMAFPGRDRIPISNTEPLIFKHKVLVSR